MADCARLKTAENSDVLPLRSVAVASGLAAIVINWVCCRWVFGWRTAAISTVALAVLPVNIAYSRIAWDASQSLAATLPVTYFALAAVQRPQFRWRPPLRRRQTLPQAMFRLPFRPARTQTICIPSQLNRRRLPERVGKFPTLPLVVVVL